MQITVFAGVKAAVFSRENIAKSGCGQCVTTVKIGSSRNPELAVKTVCTCMRTYGTTMTIPVNVQWYRTFLE